MGMSFGTKVAGVPVVQTISGKGVVAVDAVASFVERANDSRLEEWKKPKGVMAACCHGVAMPRGNRSGAGTMSRRASQKGRRCGARNL